MVGKIFFCSKFPDILERCYGKEEGDQRVSWTTSLGSISAVFFEVSCKSISHKSLSLIKTENCLVLFNKRNRR